MEVTLAVSCVQDCESGYARCCTILCEIDRLPATGSVVITVTSRLWSSTFLEVRNISRVPSFLRLMLTMFILAVYLLACCTSALLYIHGCQPQQNIYYVSAPHRAETYV